MKSEVKWSDLNPDEAVFTRKYFSAVVLNLGALQRHAYNDSKCDTYLHQSFWFRRNTALIINE